MADGADPSGDDAPVTRDEYERLRRRIEQLEATLARQQAQQPGTPPPRPLTLHPGPTRVAPAAAPTPTPAPRPPPAAPRPAAAPVPRPATPARAASDAVGFETLLGERFAPRVGALLVFLASLFFLGVGIQRGWIGPLAQLGIAVTASLALLGVADWLTRRKGYGTYPQVLEGTAVSVLYATAFVAYTVPYYNERTHLTELGGGLLMALVASLAIGLALARDARAIAGLGYSLGFLTAGFGWGVFPELTLAYVAILGTTLALVVMRRGWVPEGVLGSLATGGFLVGFAFDAIEAPPSAWVVIAAAIAPAIALFALALRPREQGVDETPHGILAGATLLWSVLVTTVPFAESLPTVGWTLFAWVPLAGALAAVAARRDASRAAMLAFGVGAVALYLAAPMPLFDGTAQADLAITLTYAVGGLALALAQRAFPGASRGLWNAGLALAGAAALRAVFVDQRFSLAEAAVFGSFEAWVTFALLAPALVLLFALAPQGRASAAARLAFAIGVAFLGLWAFALYGSDVLTTFHLLLVGAALVAAAGVGAGAGGHEDARAGGRDDGTLARDAAFAGIALVLVASIKATVYDAWLAEPSMPGWLAGLEAVVVAATLLALHHARTSPRAASFDAAPVLVGASAAVLGGYALAYAQGAWTSVLLGVLGVAYLAVGFVLKSEAVYRYVGFAALGFVLLRVFTVDLREADLVVRAAVFAALGVILLLVGYAYARANRAAAAASGASPRQSDASDVPEEPHG